MRSRWVGKYNFTKTGIRFLTGLGFLFSALLLPVPFANGLPIGGIIATTTMTLSGNNIIDSFDSSNPSYSLWHSNWWYQGRNFGTYTNTMRTDQAVVATDASVLTLNGGDVIYGYVSTGPGGTVTNKGSGNSVGELAWIGPNPLSPINIGIEPGHQQADMNVIFNDVMGPIPINSLYNSTTGWPNGRWLSPGYYPLGTNISGKTYYYLVTNVPGLTTSPSNKVYYTLASIANNNASIFIGASNCVFLMTNGITMKNGDNLTVDVINNANVEIYTGGTFDTGNGSVNEAYQYAPTFKIYGLPTCTSIIFPGNATLTAWVYAPEASVTFNGGGIGPVDIGGAFMVQSIALKGHFNFHYDQVLRTNNLAPPVLSWLTPTNEIVPIASSVTFSVYADGNPPLYYQWFLNQTNLIEADTNLTSLLLSHALLSDAGSYSVIVTNMYGSVTSAPASLIVYTNATPTLTIDSSSVSGLFQFGITGVPGLHYSVQASSNLVDWAPLTTNVSPFTFFDTNMTAFPQRFYRSVFIQ